MSLRDLQRELRTVEQLISTLSPDAGFVEDLVCLEMNRKALAAALSIERGSRRKKDPLDRFAAWLDAGRMPDNIVHGSQLGQLAN
jgi:hypothetical protein